MPGDCPVKQSEPETVVEKGAEKIVRHSRLRSGKGRLNFFMFSDPQQLLNFKMCYSVGKVGWKKFDS